MRHAIVVSGKVPPSLREEVAAGLVPRRDYLDLSDALDARLLNNPFVPPKGGMVAAGLAQAIYAFRRRHEYDAVLTDSEHVGIPLALLLKQAGVRKRHVMITHRLSPLKKVVCFRALHVETHIDVVVTYSAIQEKLALTRLRLPREKVVRVLHAADHHFWRPLGRGGDRVICSAGLEFRDYPTLIQAAGSLDLRIDIAAASPWSQRANHAERVRLPSNVNLGRRSYAELRELYDRAAFVVVPVFDVDFQAGSLVMYEAMSMGKAVIATRTRAHQSGEILRDGETGLLVPPDDPRALRETIVRLERSPDEAARMGRAARAIVESGLNHDRYVEQMVDLVAGRPRRSVAAAGDPTGARPTITPRQPLRGPARLFSAGRLSPVGAVRRSPARTSLLASGGGGDRARSGPRPGQGD